MARLFFGLFLILGFVKSNSNECQKRTYYHDSFVCVCNLDSCDQVSELPRQIGKDEAVVYSTSLSNDRLTKSLKLFERKNGSKLNTKGSTVIQISIDTSKKFQEIIGFGGAITDASMKILNDLKNTSLSDMLFRQYYGPKSVSYTLGRVPIASCDFSTTNYSYLDQINDFELETFSLSEHEYGKWDFLAKAQNVSNPPLRLFSSPWSAPAWIKTNNMMQLGGSLKDGPNSKYALLYAKYFIRFFEEYARKGVNFWATTIQNEPSMSGEVDWQSMEFNTTHQKIFVQNRLGPMMRQNWATKDVKIIVHDDFQGGLFDAAKEYYDGNSSYIDGLAFHWYGGKHYGEINSSYHLKPENFLISSEACNGYATEHAPQLGSWDFAEQYASDIIQTLLNNAAGWCDWNIWLDEQGGSNWVGNFVDSPIIVNVTGNEFYKQPMYYIMGHFSKFVLPGSFRIHTEVDKIDDKLDVIAFETPEKRVVVVVLNRSADRSFNLTLSIMGHPDKQLDLMSNQKSIQTIIWEKTGHM